MILKVNGAPKVSTHTVQESIVVMLILGQEVLTKIDLRRKMMTTSIAHGTAMTPKLQRIFAKSGLRSSLDWLEATTWIHPMMTNSNPMKITSCIFHECSCLQVGWIRRAFRILSLDYAWDSCMYLRSLGIISITQTTPESTCAEWQTIGYLDAE